MSTFARCAVVAQDGAPILFEHQNSIHRSRTRAVVVRPMHPWEFHDDPAAEAAVWAGEIVGALRELGVDPAGAPLAVDRLGTPASLALADLGVRLVDSAPVTQEARRVKTPEEIALFELNAPLIHAMLETFEERLAPGVFERELLGEMARVLIRGRRRVPRDEHRLLGTEHEPVAGRGDRPARPRRRSRLRRHRRGRDRGVLLLRLADVRGGRADRGAAIHVRGRARVGHRHEGRDPRGMTCADVAAVAPPLPERFVPQRYECLVHGIGLEEENPSVCHPPDGQPNGDTVLEPGTILVVECYMARWAATTA